ncbi:MAG: fimbrial assembly protein [Burkholderiaceae bacterium]|jgi:type IV pilus assembly protein PilV|nr:fimbrial assembly protein [Burkholderiaceae bacterium]
MNTLAFHTISIQARRARSGSGGFALLEALVALLLFSIGILGLLGLQARAISTNGDTEYRDRAALIADQCASQMQLQAGSVTISNINGSGLTTLCTTQNWKNYVADPTQGGLPQGMIQVVAPAAGTTFTIVAGGAPLAPAAFDITITWTAPVQANAKATPITDSLTTRTTLLVANS